MGRGRRCRFLGRKAYKELICLGYGKKGPLFDQFSRVEESTLDPERRHKSLLRGIKYRVKSCNPHSDSIKSDYLAYARQRCTELHSQSIELLAYRKAIGVPSPYTREEAAAESREIVRIID